MKVVELFEVADQQHAVVKDRAQKMMDELVSIFKLSKGGATYLHMFGTHAALDLAKLGLGLPSTLKGNDLEFRKKMMEKHVPLIVKKHFPEFQPREGIFDESVWHKNREYFKLYTIPKSLRKKFNGVIVIGKDSYDR